MIHFSVLLSSFYRFFSIPAPFFEAEQMLKKSSLSLDFESKHRRLQNCIAPENFGKQYDCTTEPLHPRHIISINFEFLT